MENKRENVVDINKKINLSIHEANQLFGIGENTIRRLLHEKGCPFLLKIGNRHLVKRREFEKYLQGKHYI